MMRTGRDWSKVEAPRFLSLSGHREHIPGGFISVSREARQGHRLFANHEGDPRTSSSFGSSSRSVSRVLGAQETSHP